MQCPFNLMEFDIDQRKILSDMYGKTFHIIKVQDDDNVIVIKLSNVKSQIYTLKVGENTIKCDCGDKLICEHICFLYLRIGLFKNVEFFINRYLRDEYHKKLKILLNSLECKPTIYEAVVQFNEKLRALKCMFMKDNNKPPEDCIICYKSIQNDFVSCPDCFNKIHRKCMNKWLENKNTCIYCRSDIWEDYKYLAGYNPGPAS